MTRKRFIKLLMADGISPKDARWMADYTLKSGDSYFYGYLAHKLAQHMVFVQKNEE